MKEYTNVYYFNHINTIGGIETFFYQLANKYGQYDITIICKTGDSKQIERLKKHVRVIFYNGQTIKCKRAFFNYNIDIIDNIIAEEYIQVLHGDYRALGIVPKSHPKITRYIGVSKLVCDSYYELTGIMPELVYNPFELIEEPKKVLFLLSATRLTKEKGKERIEKFAEMLDKANIPYIWLIFTDNTNAINNPNIIYKKPRLDIVDYIKKADYLVQLSDTESYCYSIVEALSIGTPIIATKMPVLEELGINEEYGFLLDFDLLNVDIKGIYNKQFNFKYKPPTDGWEKQIIKEKSKYKEELKMKYLVEALDTYRLKNLYDANLGRVPKEGEQFIVDKARLDILLGENKYNIPFVKVIEEIKEEKQEEITIEEKTTKKPKTTKKKVK